MIVHILGNIQGTPSFQLVKMNIESLLKQRDRKDLIPVWETFLGKFPCSEGDQDVPYDDIYGELLSLGKKFKRYVFIV